MIDILYLADSHGYAIEQQLQQIIGDDNFITIHTIITNGGTILEVTRAGLQYAKGTTFQQVYLHTGVNNLTIKVGNHEVTPAFNNWSKMVHHMMIEYYTSRSALAPYGELVGLQLGLYNHSRSNYPHHQNLIIRGVMRINEYIAEMNRQAQVFSPYFCGLTHK